MADNFLPASGSRRTSVTLTRRLFSLRPSMAMRSAGLYFSFRNDRNVTGVLRVMFVVVALLCGALPVQAGINQWTSGGPDSDVVQTVAVDPQTPSTIYVGTNGGGVYKSIDDGISWKQMSTGLPGHVVRAIAIDPVTPTTLYAGMYYGSGLFKSIDGGQTWEDRPFCNLFDIQSIVVDSHNPSTLFFLTDSGLHKSSDGGGHCDSITPPDMSFSFRSLAVNPQNSNVLYAGTQNGVFKTSDGGATWGPANDGITYPFVQSLAIDPVTPSVLYAATPVGIFKSTDSGTSWSNLNYELVGYRFNTMAVDPTTPSTIYAGSFGHGGYKSTDGGASWAQFGGGISNGFIIAITFHPATSSTLYTGTIDGIFKSVNGANSWTRITPGFRSSFMTSLSSDPVTPSTVYAGSNGSGIFKSTDGGASWSHHSSGLTTGYIMTVQTDPTDSDTVYAGTFGQGLFKSVDGGLTWNKKNTGLDITSFIGAIAIDPTSSDMIFAGDAVGGGLYKSEDGGDNWAHVDTLPASLITSLAIDKTTPAIIYAGSGSGGVFKSTDGGATWVPQSVGLPAGSIKTLAIDPAMSSLLYAVVEQQGIFKSTDGGATWNSVNTGLPASTVTSLTMNPAAPAELYAGTATGIYRSVNGGQSWSPFNTGMETIPVNAVIVAGSTVYAGTTSGVYAFTSAPAIAVSPSPVDFGQLPVNLAGLKFVTISNTGTAPLVVSTPVSITGPDAASFRIRTGGLQHPCDSLTPTIAAGDGCQVALEFLASSGTKTATLHIDSNAAIAPALDVPITGTGYAPPVSLTVNIVGSGTVNNTNNADPPTPFSCSNPACTATFDYGTDLALRATPSALYEFTGWTMGNETFTGDFPLLIYHLKYDTTVTATFSHLPLVRNVGSNSSYLNFAAALAEADGSTTFLTRNVTFNEDITLDRPLDIILNCGFASNFLLLDGFTELQGVLTVGQGSLTVDNLAIR